MNNINQKKMTLGILLVGIVMLTIGFAAYTASLTIKSTATVTPNSSNFGVVFSKSSTSVDTSDVTVDSTSTTTGTPGKINDTTISNLSANFTAPNQKAIYKFYAYNKGEYVAYLNSITFLGEKTCTATGDVTEELLNNACNSIKMTVQVGSTTTEVTKPNITGESIDPKEAALVTVTLEYEDGGAVADGTFTVNFSGVSLYYGTREGLTEEIVSSKPCTLTDSDSDGIADIGEMVSCGEENFYTMENNTTTIAMLSEKNITLADGTTDYPRQSDDAGTIAFSSSNYWWDNSNETWAEGYPLDGLNFVYDSNSNLYPYVEAYETYLKSRGVSSASASLLSESQYENFENAGGFDIFDELNFYANESWWTGSSSGSGSWWDEELGAPSDGEVIYHMSAIFEYDYGNGLNTIRPVITISVSELG